MSGSAKVDEMEWDLNEIASALADEEGEFAVPALVVGDPLEGTVCVTNHECPFCHAKMQTVGVGHGIYYCSWCAARRGRTIEMKRQYECLEIVE